jgi:hypothetical protein
MGEVDNLQEADSSIETAVSGGNPSYKGYVYQKRVTAWVALSLLLERPDEPNEIIVEPASDEDIEAKLNVKVDSAIATVVVPGTVKLTIQIKFRGAGHWSADAFAELVKDKVKKGNKGPNPRPRARSLLLSEPARRYVLITNTSVDQTLSSGRIRKIDEIPENTFLPPKLARGNEADLLRGRWGFIEGLSWGALDAELRRLFESIGHVPSTRVVDAQEKLERAIEDRLMGLAAPLTREQVVAIIESAGGLPHREQELAEFIPPPAAAAASTLLVKEHAVLLLGSPGFGKSLIAKHLVHEYRINPRPFEVIRETEGIAGIDTLLSAPGRHVFHLDDPWGQSKLENNASDWVVKLPGLLRRATPDKLFIITSRTDILRLARVGVNEAPWGTIACTVTQTDYDDAMRWKILNRKLQGATSWQQDFARKHQDTLVTKLTSPLAVERFARALLACSNLEAAEINTLIDQAQVESIRRIVSQQVEGWASGGIACATIVWVMVRRSETISPERLRAIRRRLEEGPRPLEIDLDRFVAHFQTATLTVGDNGALGAHGKVVEALEEVITNHPANLERTLDRTAAALLRLYEYDPSYLVELIRLIDAINSLAPMSVSLSVCVREEIDKLLIVRLLTTETRAFASAFRDILLRATDQAPIARLVRYLDRGAPKPKRNEDGRGWADFGWRPPALTASEKASLLVESMTQHVLAMWISHIFPFESEDYDANKLLSWLEQFGFDLAPAFLTACDQTAKQRHFLMNADTVFEGAIRTGAPPSKVFSHIESLDQVIVAERNQRDTAAPHPLQGELDFAVQLHLVDELEEEGSAVEHAVKGYVRGRRRLEGCEWIIGHERPDLILRAWAEAMNFAMPKVTVEELDAYFALASTPALRARGLRIIGERKVTAGRSWLVEALRTGTLEERESAAHAFRWIANEGQVEAELIAAMTEVDAVGQIELFLAGVELGTYKEDRIDWMRRLRRGAPAVAQDLLAFVTLAKERADGDQLVAAYQRLPVEQVEALLATAPKEIAQLLLSISAHEGRDVTGAAERFLLSDDDNDVCAAIDALGRIGGTSARETIGQMLDHNDYRVRRFAMQTLAKRAMDAAERAVIFERRKDPSAPVREALAVLIGEQRWNDGIGVLLELLTDTRDYNHHPEHDRWPDPQFEVARKAARALDAFCPLSGDKLKSVIAFVDQGVASSADIGLHAILIDLLARHDDDRIVTLLSQYLDDDRVVGQAGEMLFPIRYAAGWSLCQHLDIAPNRIAAVNWSAVERAAGHADPQLAAPGLCLLGRTLEQPRPETLNILRASETTEPRRILSLLMLDDVRSARTVVTKFALLPQNHPMLAVEPNDDLAERSTWPSGATAEAWLRALDPDEDVHRVLLWFASLQTELDLGTVDFDFMALRRMERVPIITMAEMSGME